MNKHLASTLAWVVVVVSLLGIVQFTMQSEDSFFFNCHLNGNMECGSNSGWLGYVNWRV